jgi:hypothetical protein
MMNWFVWLGPPPAMPADSGHSEPEVCMIFVGIRSVSWTM